jgi:hypothetical protein
MGDGFTSPPKDVALRVFIALKNPSISAGLKPATLESSGKNANHYTTEDGLTLYVIFS